MYISFKFSNCCYKSIELLEYLIINDAVLKKAFDAYRSTL